MSDPTPVRRYVLTESVGYEDVSHEQGWRLLAGAVVVVFPASAGMNRRFHRRHFAGGRWVRQTRP